MLACTTFTYTCVRCHTRTNTYTSAPSVVQPNQSRTQIRNTPVSLNKTMKSELYDLIIEFKEKWPLEGSTRKKCDDLVKRMVLDGREDEDSFNLFKSAIHIIREAVEY